MDELHRLSAILIERETIDKDQFERLLAGEAEESVFPRRSPEPAIEEPRGREEAGAAARSRARSRARRCSLRRRIRRPASPDRVVRSCGLRAAPRARERRVPSRASRSRAQRARLRGVVVEHRAHPRVAGLRAGEQLAARDEPRGEPRRSRAACARLRRTDGLHVLGARRRRRRGRLRLRLSVARRRRTTLTSSRGCARRMPSSMCRCGRPSRPGSTGWPFERPLYAPLLG